MGKVGGGGLTTTKKKKGRPSLLDLKKRALEQQQLQNQQQLQQRRSARRNPNSSAAASAEDGSVDEDEYYDDDEREQKKVKLVVRLPQSNQQQHLSSDLFISSSVNSGSCGSDSHADVDNRIINSGSGDIFTDHRGEKVSKALDTLHGSPLESGATTPLPEKKLLTFILERLQKKDTHGVFSEPVDPNELPDYHEIVKRPMDFGTVRSKLDEGLYSNLDELEADVFLICSNAMQYNSSDTIYFRQAKSIQELAKRDFENLRQEGDDGELQPKVVKRGRPPGKHPKKPPGRPPLDRAGPESTSGATLATAEDNTNEATPYNLRRGPMLYRFQADGLLPSHHSRSGEHYSEWSSDWNEEFPAHIRRADMKYGNKHFNIDETRRDTYSQFFPSDFVHEPSLLSNFGGERKQLLAVGLHAEHGYARSLACFAANMGPVVWNIASKKIEKSLPPGIHFAPGVVGENEPSPPSMLTPSASGANPAITNHPKEEIDAHMRVNSQKDSSMSITGPNKPLSINNRNGCYGDFNVSQMEMFESQHDDIDARSTIVNARGTTLGSSSSSWQQASSTKHRPFTLHGASRQQPDLALQL